MEEDNSTANEKIQDSRYFVGTHVDFLKISDQSNVFSALPGVLRSLNQRQLR